MRGFADALEQVCTVLAENSGMDPIQSLAEAKSKQLSEDSHVFGIACMHAQVDDMRKLEVFETVASKKLQVQLAAQVVKMILKIDDVIIKAMV